MTEAALVFDKQGRTLYWHEPEGATAASLPDSHVLWEVLWQQRERLGGVAHTHPARGRVYPSFTDVTTWAAIEAGLGRKLVWPIVGTDDVRCFRMRGEAPVEIVGDQLKCWPLEELDELRRRSGV